MSSYYVGGVATGGTPCSVDHIDRILQEVHMIMKRLIIFTICFTFFITVAYAHRTEFQYREGVMVGVGIGPSG